MKKIIILGFVVCFAVLFTGCSTTIKHAQFEDSNQMFIEETAAQMDLGSKIGDSLVQGNSVAVVSMETSNTLDAPIVAVIEDQMIISLVKHGYKVAERDQHLIEKLDNESRKSSYSYRSSEKLGLPENCEAEIELDYEKINELSERLIETKISKADYLISYRVLECGLIYRPTKSDNPNIGREGMLRLHVRIEDTRTGEIILAENFESRKTDEIEKMFINKLEEFHYTNFEYDYPYQSKPKRKKLFMSPVVKSSSQNAFYFAPTCGLGISEEGEGFCFGGTIGYCGKRFGRLGVNYCGTPEIETNNITLQYEKPLSDTPVTFTPKLGLGYLHSTRDHHGYWGDSWERDYDSFGGVLGGALEINIARCFSFKAGYDWFIGIGESDASSSAVTGVLGFKF